MAAQCFARRAARRAETWRLATRGLFACILLLACDRTRAGTSARSRPLHVNSAWARAADSGTTGGAYLSLTNTDAVPIEIVGWSSPAARVVELHESMSHSGMVHMAARPSMRISPDSSLAMAPGSVHVMLSDLQHALRVGDTIAVTVNLSDGRSVRVPVGVRSP